MKRFVSWVAPRSLQGFVLKMLIVITMGNLFAMGVVYSVHGRFPSGLSGQLIETTIIAAPFAFGFLKIISYLYELQVQLHKIAHTDVLTGLPNRRAFLEHIEERLQSGEPTSLFLADADHFKQINDRYGHDGGDDCLRAIAQHLRKVAGPTNHLARVGGEEFTLLVMTDATDDLDRIGERLIEPIPFHVTTWDGKKKKAHVTLSVGGVVVKPGSTPSANLMIADHRLYHAKETGRGRFVLEDQTEMAASSVA